MASVTIFGWTIQIPFTGTSLSSATTQTQTRGVQLLGVGVTLPSSG